MSELNERAKRQIALLAGGDLEGEQSIEARRSIDVCPECRRHWIRLKGCLDILDRSGRGVEPVCEASLWPSIELRLRRSTPIRVPQKFNGWVPALSMAAACILLLIAGRLDESATGEGLAPREPIMASGAGQIRWISSGLKEEMRKASPRLTEEVRYYVGDMQGVEPSRDRLAAPVSWTYRLPSQ